VNPLSITLQNFLCYDTLEDGSPYIFNFREHRLWSICGDNGAGKSAIFDVITYCLYGEHRGGREHDEELVHRGTTDLYACVEFEHGGREYRVTRTIKLGFRPRKGTATIDRNCRMEWRREDGEWVEMAETTSVRSLEEAVKKILGYGCDTLTASVLLLQGKSDQLIEVASKDRFEILSGILDLSPYERLEGRAKDKARDARARHNDLVRALENAPPPDEAEVQAAELEAQKAELSLAAAVTARTSAERTLEAATEYWKRHDRLAGLRTDEATMVEALKDAATITAEAREHDLLAITLPRLNTALDAEAKAASAEAEAETARKAAAGVDVSGAEKATEKADAAHNATRLQRTEVLKRISEGNDELGQIAPEISAAKDLMRLQTQITTTSAEVGTLESESASLAELRPRVERLRKLVSASTLIGSYRKAREALAKAEEVASGDPAAELDRRKVGREQAETLAVAAAIAQSDADRALARAEADVRSAARTLGEREAAGSEGICSHCGQKVPPAHIKSQVAEARKAVASARELQATAQHESVGASERRTEADSAVSRAKSAETEAAEWLRRAKEAQTTIDDLAAGEEFSQLPEDVRGLLRAPLPKLAKGLDVLRVEQDQLKPLSNELSRLEAAAAQAVAKSDLIEGWDRERISLLERWSMEQLAAAMARDGVLRDGLTVHHAEEKRLSALEEMAAGELRSAEGRLKLLAAERQQLEETARLREQAAKGCHQEAKAALTGVDPVFLPVTAAIVARAGERLALLVSAPDRLATLRSAQSGLDTLRGQIGELQSHVDATPPAERVTVAEAKVAVNSASQEAGRLLEEAKTQRRSADELARVREQRLKSQAEADGLARTRAVWDKVSQLLGRSGIQTALMRSALEDIQERANAMLSRISAGQLQLSITCEPIPKGMEIFIRCLDASSAEQPLDVQFLSGGQRFRCAVALAAGIGQRAGSEGSMPSQIIDEGFGSLDTEGRREMLDEIRQMSEFYERVIVVSHMDSFHDQALFPARYELRKEGMHTVVTASL